MIKRRFITNEMLNLISVLRFFQWWWSLGCFTRPSGSRDLVGQRTQEVLVVVVENACRTRNLKIVFMIKRRYGQNDTANTNISFLRAYRWR